MAGFLNLANIKKTWYYFQKNGIKNACLAVWERLEQKKQQPYVYTAPDRQQLERQKKQAEDLFLHKPDEKVCFSILVPAYETKAEYLTALLDSVLEQSYSAWELVIADAGTSSMVWDTLEAWTAAKQVQLICKEQDKIPFADRSVRYIKLEQNGGISENTNAGLAFVKGRYVGLLDHDDVLTPDALFEMAQAVQGSGQVFYSDEDKCDGSGQFFYEPHFKTDFDPEMLLTNNYICHFTVMETALMRRLKLRSEYDGAQDFDLVLRAYLAGAEFVHVPKVLYHWRCHEDSTAVNPRSKTYAYDAGRRAVEDFCRQKGWQVTVTDTAHLGFYRVEYANLWQDRPEIGAVAYPVIQKGHLCSGIYEQDGQLRFAGLRAGFSGYIHRAALQQSAKNADVRQMKVRTEWEEKRLLAVRNCKLMNPRTASGQFAQLLEENGLKILWDPKGK